MFRVNEFEEIGMLLPQVENSVTDLSRFRKIVTFVAFQPFKSALDALNSINCISEGIVPDDLKIFLDSCIPKSKKKEVYTLGVLEPKLGANITELLNIKCDHATAAIPEIIRGIRTHFCDLVKHPSLTAQNTKLAQLGLGHSYSRCKIKFNVHRVDNMIIQSISLLDQLDKDINTFAMRIRYVRVYILQNIISIIC